MGNLRTCTVSFCEPKGTGRFSVEVTAESTFEAAVRALKIFRQEEWCTEAVYASGYLEISVKSPVVEYKILLEDLDRRLKQPGGSPRDIALRQKLNAILD